MDVPFSQDYRRQFTFYHQVPGNTWYSLDQPRKDERLCQPWSQPVVLKTGPLGIHYHGYIQIPENSNEHVGLKTPVMVTLRSYGKHIALTTTYSFKVDFRQAIYHLACPD